MIINKSINLWSLTSHTIHDWFRSNLQWTRLDTSKQLTNGTCWFRFISGSAWQHIRLWLWYCCRWCYTWPSARSFIYKETVRLEVIHWSQSLTNVRFLLFNIVLSKHYSLVCHQHYKADFHEILSQNTEFLRLSSDSALCHNISVSEAACISLRHSFHWKYWQTIYTNKQTNELISHPTIDQM